MLTKRTHILFDKELWKRLTDLAESTNTSVGSLVRQAVEEKYLNQDKLVRRQQAIASTLKTRVHLKGTIDYKELIDHGRKY